MKSPRPSAPNSLERSSVWRWPWGGGGGLFYSVQLRVGSSNGQQSVLYFPLSVHTKLCGSLRSVFFAEDVWATITPAQRHAETN